MSPAFRCRAALVSLLVSTLLAARAHASAVEVLGRAETGTLYLDGNELVGPFVFKTDGYWLFLDAHRRSGVPVKDLVLGDSIGQVPPDSGKTTARPNDVAAVMDRASVRNEQAGVPEAERLEKTIQLARGYPRVVESAYVAHGQGVVHFRGHRDAYVFELGSKERDSAQAAQLGIPTLPRGDLIRANAQGLIQELEEGTPLLAGIGYSIPCMGRSKAEVAAKADSLRRGQEQAWPSEFDWARDDVRSPRPLEKRLRHAK